MKVNNKYETYPYTEPGEGNMANYDRYANLPWQLNEMLNEIADEKDKDIIVQNINTYYDSLNTLLLNHIIEHPRMSIS